MHLMRCISLLLIAALLSACATSPTGRPQLMMFSPEDTIAYSEKAYLSTVNDLRNKKMLMRQSRYTESVRTTTGRVVMQAVKRFPHTRGWKWSIAVIDAPGTINAWAMAGGRMAVYTGLINKLRLTEAEFAQVIGHEIGHAVANHTAERMSMAFASQLSVLGVAISSKASPQATQNAVKAVKHGLLLPNSRSGELEADRIGIELAALAGYDPWASVTLWEKMERVAGSGPQEFLSTHPSPGNRRARLKKLVPEMRGLLRRTRSPAWPVALAQ